jgi:hypothetical protein
MAYDPKKLKGHADQYLSEMSLIVKKKNLKYRNLTLTYIENLLTKTILTK